MSWEGYKKRLKKSLVKTTLEELGLPEFSLTLRPPVARPWGETKRLGMTAAKVDEIDPLEAVELIERQVAENILEWNLTDPETDEPLPIPAEDPSVLERLPTEVLFFIQRKLREQFEQAVPT